MGASVTSRYCWSKQCRFRRTEAWIAISPTWNETNLVFSKVTSLQRRIPIYIDCAPEPPQIMRHSVLLPANMMSMWPAAGFNSNLSKPIKTVCWFLVWRLFWPSSPPGAAASCLFPPVAGSTDQASRDMQGVTVGVHSRPETSQNYLPGLSLSLRSHKICFCGILMFKLLNLYFGWPWRGRQPGG